MLNMFWGKDSWTKQLSVDDWTCKGCGFRLYGSKTKCFKCNLDRNGKSVLRSGDWKCKGCDFLLYANKTHCRKCNLDRNGNSILRLGDWICHGCKFKIYGSKKKCSKCNMDKNGNIILPSSSNKGTTNKGTTNENTTNKNTDSSENKLCTVCWVQQKNTILIHENGKDAHQCCCYVCANKIFRDGNKKCPICNQMIKQIIKVYN